MPMDSVPVSVPVPVPVPVPDSVPAPILAEATCAPSSPPRRPMVEVSHLRREFGSTVAVDDLSFSVGEAEIFGFIGPNGAGKTTTLRILATLLDPSSGQAT